MIIVICIMFGLCLAAIIVAACLDGGGGTWVKQDGTIIEWDGDGGGRIVRPDGTLEEYKK